MIDLGRAKDIIEEHFPKANPRVKTRRQATIAIILLRGLRFSLVIIIIPPLKRFNCFTLAAAPSFLWSYPNKNLGPAPPISPTNYAHTGCISGEMAFKEVFFWR